MTGGLFVFSVPILVDEVQAYVGELISFLTGKWIKNRTTLSENKYPVEAR
jgi:hypothetical protein